MIQEVLAEIIEVRPGRRIFCRHWVLGDEGISATQTCTNTINLVCVHGTAASQEQFLPLWKALNDLMTPSDKIRIHCLSFDAIGCGNSPKLKEELAYQDSEHVNDLEALTKKYLDLQFKTFFLGHSYGPTWIFKYLQQRRKKQQDFMAPVILIGSGLRCDELKVGGPALFRLPVFILNCLQPLLSSSFMKIGFSSWTHKNNPKLISEALKGNNQNDMQVCSYYYRAHAWLSEVENVKSRPALILHGVEDGVVPLKCGQQLANHLKTSLVSIENASHMVHLEQTNEVAKHVWSFLQKHK